MLTTEQKTDLLFLLLVAETVTGLRREHAREISAKSGPRDNGYHATFVEPLEEYLLTEFYGYWRRESLRATRREAARI
jgi:hypothetical protein